MALKAENRKPKTESGATHATIDGGQAGNGGARRWLVGTNVVLMTVLALAVAGAVQYGGYQVQNRAGGRWDLTSARTNRLAPATENLLKRLDKKVWITSLYYQSDEEREDQGQYRTRMNDLINLYQLANRAQVEVEFINPVKDHERHESLIKRLSEIPKYRDESAKHVEATKTFREKIAPQVSQLIESETASARDLARTAGEQRGEILSQLVERVLPNAQSKLAQLQEDVTDALAQTPPRYAALVPEINQFYNDMTKMLNSIATEGPKEAAVGKLSAEVAAFYNGAKDRYRDAINAMSAGVTQTQNLPNLELETLVQQLQRGLKTNPLVVSTADDATVIPFEEIWPPVDPNMPPSVVGYKDREFRGEEKITSAILKLTSKEKTAVVFVRYGGQPLFGMGMPWQGTPHGTMTNLKERLEEANFQIEEWDLQSQPQQPPINPAPKRSIYVVLKPQQNRNPFMQQNQPQFGPAQEMAVKNAVGSAGRAIFIAGWTPMPGLPGALLPDRYEYNSYLKDQWGLDVDSGHVVLRATAVGPSRFMFTRGAEVIDDEAKFSNHPVCRGLGAYRTAFMQSAPLNLADKPPEGVQLEKLVWTDPKLDTIWGVGDFQKYIEQKGAAEGMQKVPEDPMGPFTLAVIGSKADKKVAVISAVSFVDDQVAMQRELVMMGNGIAMRWRNPGNLRLFVNLLHWLNDNTEWMNLGTPIEASVLKIEEGPKFKFLRALIFAVWPALALACGGAVWWVRRR